MRLRVSPLALAAALLALLAGCATEPLLRQADYTASREALARADYAAALARFPEGEAGTFITTMERTYLALLQGRPDIDALAAYRHLLGERVRVVVSRELRSFFYLETPEGYYASEHEVVWMHLLLSWGYSLRGEREKGCVEARQAGHLLTARWSEEGHFDDPMSRSILGVLWALCGAWQDAQVDFRVAAALDPSLAWAAALAERVAPPRNLFLVLGGVGPEPVWDPVLSGNPVRGARRLDFPRRGRRSAVFIDAAGARQPLHLTPDATPWYARHQARDNAIQEAISDTRYGLEATAEAGWAVTKTGGAAAYWAGVTTLGAVAGAAIVYGAAQSGGSSGMEYAVALGIAIPAWAYRHGKGVYEDVERESAARFRRHADPTRRYRYVRFLPEYAWVGWSDRPLGERPTLVVQGAGVPAPGSLAVAPVRRQAPRVFIAHLPDAGQHVPVSGAPHWVPDAPAPPHRAPDAPKPWEPAR